MGWFDGIKRFLGKVGSGVMGAVRLFNKAKDVYGSAKNTIANLPVIGSAASSLIERGEGKVNEAMKRKIGVDMKDINKGVGIAEKVASYLPKQ